MNVIGPTMNGLLRFDENLEIINDAVESWKQVDDKTYTFTLRKGVRFHDIAPVSGREMTSADVEATVLRSKGAAPYNKFTAPHSLAKETWSPVKSMELIDDRTIKFHLSGPSASFLNMVADPASVIYPKEGYDGKYDVRQKVIGSGPFMVTNAQPEVSFTMEKNPKYFEAGKPYLDKVTAVVIKDPSARRAAFAAKQVDIISSGDKDLKDQALRDVPTAHVVKTPAVTRLIAIEPKGPLANYKVRRAIFKALGPEEMLQLVADGDGRLTMAGVVGKWSLPEQELKQLFGPDIAESKRLLQEAGYADGFNVTIRATDRQQPSVEIAQVAVNQLAKVNIKAKVEVLEFATFLDERSKGNYEMLSHAWSWSLDPDARIAGVYLPGGSWASPEMPEIVDLIKKQRQELDLAKRIELVHKIQRVNVEKYLFNFNVLQTYDFDILQGHVQGWARPQEYFVRFADQTWLKK